MTDTPNTEGVPATVHGWPVIAATPTPKAAGTRPGAVILVQRTSHSHHPYVTAWIGRDAGSDWDGSWSHGHYFADYKQAEADYVSRARRGY